MSVQSEAQLENELIEQLKNLGYHQVDLKDENQLLSNLKFKLNAPMTSLLSLQMNGHKFSIILRLAIVLTVPRCCVIAFL